MAVQADLKTDVKSLQQEIEEQERQTDNIKVVYVNAPDKSSGKRK